MAPDGAGGFYSAGGDGMLVHWPAGADDGVLMARIPDNVYSLARFDAAAALMAGTRQGELFRLNLDGSGDVRRLTAHSGGLFGLLPHGERLLSSGGDGRLLEWNACLDILRGHAVSAASTRALLPLESGWLAGSSDHLIRRLDEHLYVLETWSGHTGSVFALEALPGGRVVSGGRDAILRVWTAEGELLQSVNAHLLHIHDLKLSPGGTWLGSASMDKTIKIWDPLTMELLKVIDRPKLDAHSASVNRLLWLDDNTLVSAGDDRRILVTGLE